MRDHNEGLWPAISRRRALALSGGALLTGCTGLDTDKLFSDAGPGGDQPQPPLQPQAEAARVGMLLPLTAPGQTGRIGQAMKQAAEMALFDLGARNVTLIAKDTGGNPTTAISAAQAALGEGAEILLGPLLATSVSAVAPEARKSNVPVVAFSSVAAVAGSGVYLMSFLPQEEVLEVVRYAVSKGRRNLAALLPRSPYGATIERALVKAAKAHRARVAILERYPRTPAGLSEPARRIAAAASNPSLNVQALLLPEGGQLLQAAGNALTSAGFSPLNTKVLGTGLWDDATSHTAPITLGGWYAGVAPERVRQFTARFQKTYGHPPPRLASLAYDAVALAAVLSRSPRGNRFTAQQLLNREGFQGMNGLFRFGQDGLVDRGLAILEVTAQGPAVVAPAPTRFA